MEMFGLGWQEIMAIGSILSTMFGGLWALMAKLIFEPINNVNLTLSEIKILLAKGEERFDKLERVSSERERRLIILENKLIQQ